MDRLGSGRDGFDDKKVLVPGKQVRIDKAGINQRGLSHVAEQTWQFDHGIFEEQLGISSRHNEGDIGLAVEHQLRLFILHFAQSAAEINLDFEQPLALGVDCGHEWFDRSQIDE